MGVAVASMLCSWTGGCAGDEVTHDLVVVLRTDLRPGIEFDWVDTHILPVNLGERVLAAPEADLVAGVPVAERSGLRPGDYTVEVTLRAADGTGVGSRRVGLRLSRDESLVVVVSRGPSCESDADCADGTAACADPRCTDEICLGVAHDDRCADGEYCSAAEGCQPRVGPGDGGTPPRDAGPPDAGVDAGPPDAGPPERCVTSGGRTECTCPEGETCTLTCPEAGTTSCTARCERSSDCVVECTSGTCDVECEVGTDLCHVQCAEGARCNLNCLMGGACGASPCPDSEGCLVRCEASICYS